MNRIQVLVAGSGVESGAILEDILVSCGVNPLIASSLEEVRIVLLYRPVHLIFCEDRLPGGDLYDILRLTQAIHPEVLVVLTSLLGAWEEYLEAMQLGAFDFITPPYRTEDVVSIVDNVCRERNTKDRGDLLRSYRNAAKPNDGARRYAS
jgi:DNA-binding NtrC family response regulator